MQLFYQYELDLKLKIKPEGFIQAYQRQNRSLWREYESGRISKEVLRWQRFFEAMRGFNYADQELARRISDEYLSICPYKTNLIPHTLDLLDHLSGSYKMGIVTNGFEEVQHIKIDKSGLKPYFEFTLTADVAGRRKPHGGIFKRAIDHWQAHRTECLMIGDSFHSDIVGARNFGMDQVYYNPRRFRHNQKATYEVRCLSELLNLL